MTETKSTELTAPQSLGGLTRAENLTPEKRSEIARGAAEARWEKAARENPERTVFAKATHTGKINIGSVEIECAVLEDGTRVLSRAGFVRAIGRLGKVKGGAGHEPESKLPVFLGADNLKPFISKDLMENSSPIYFKHPKAGGISMGYKAELLPAVCNVFLEAGDAGALLESQKHIAKQCQILVRGLALVAITALVDAATGYELVRDRLALQAILDKYLRKEFAAWAKTFPDEFYEQIFRLRHWDWRGMKVNRPQVVANYTRNLIYERLGPGILAELEKRNPANDKGHRKARHFQLLTDDIGMPALSQHLYGVIGLMRASDDWDTMMRMVNRAYPKRNDTRELGLFDKDGKPI